MGKSFLCASDIDGVTCAYLRLFCLDAAGFPDILSDNTWCPMINVPVRELIGRHSAGVDPEVRRRGVLMAAKQPKRLRVVGREWELPLPRGARTVACLKRLFLNA